MESLKSAHLLWISQHPSFSPRGRFAVGESYYDAMHFLYYDKVGSISTTEWLVGYYFRSDLRDFNETQLLINNVLADINKDAKNDFFITIGFNHQTWSISSCVKVIESILEFDWILTCRAVFELHRENGEHPHVHFYIVSSIKYRSKILEKLWATKGIKKVVLSKSFIDCKNAEPYHRKYIVLDKTCCKLFYVEKDKIWRLENSIPEFFVK